MIPPFDTEQFARDSDSKVRAVPTPPPEGTLTLDRIETRFSRGDFEEALGLAEAMLVAVPLHAEAHAWATKCRDVLEQTYIANIGALTSVPTIAVSARELRMFPLDHAAGFLVAQIDGVISVETLLDVGHMPRHVALRILSDLAVRGVVVFR